MSKRIQIPIITKTDKEVLISFSRPQILEIYLEELCESFPDINKDDILDFHSWAYEKATFIHSYELEYQFSIQQDPEWIKLNQVPEKFIYLFEAARIAAKEIQSKNIEDKVDVSLRIY